MVDFKADMTFLSRLFRSKTFKIVLDGICFEWEGAHGISRVWTSLLKEWSGTPFGRSILVLDRSGAAPKFAGIEYMLFRKYEEANAAEESFILERICKRFSAKLFISTNHSTPVETPSVLLVHDLIPERWPEYDRTQPWIREKQFSTYHASAYIAISHNTARELKEDYPFTEYRPIGVSYDGVSEEFKPASAEAIEKVKMTYGLSLPYFLCAGARSGHKNIEHFFKAFSNLKDKQSFTVLCCGGNSELEPELKELMAGCDVRRLLVPEDDLNAVYSAALALVFPSKSEGFGLPVVEAMACGCPVITCPVSSTPEVAGKAALYVDPSSLSEMQDALLKIQIPALRESLIATGLERAQLFSWKKMAAEVAVFVNNAANSRQAAGRVLTCRLWRRLRQHQKDSNLNEEELRKMEAAYFRAVSLN